MTSTPASAEQCLGRSRCLRVSVVTAWKNGCGACVVTFGLAVCLSGCSGADASGSDLEDAGPDTASQDAAPDDGGSGAMGGASMGGASGSAGAGGVAGAGGMAGAAGSGSGGVGGDASVPMCLDETAVCADSSECCAGLSCGTTTLGQVCCGMSGAPCVSANGEECCGDLLCISGRCGYPVVCEGPCTAPVGLNIEHQRLVVIGGTFLGICGDQNHTFGYHVAAANLPPSDASLQGAANTPVCVWDAAAIDIGMDWPVSREWLKWLIEQIRTDAIQGVAEVIGSYDGSYVRYWSDASGWSYDGVPYQGSGHDTHTHVSIYRSTTQQDHGLLKGWTANSGP